MLNTPSEAVQRAVSACLSPLMQSKQVCQISENALEQVYIDIFAVKLQPVMKARVIMNN